MTEYEAVLKLDQISGDSEEKSHKQADAILVEFVPISVALAYKAVELRAGGWWYA